MGEQREEVIPGKKKMIVLSMFGRSQELSFFHVLKAVPHLTDLTPSSSSSAPPPQTLSIMLVKMAGCRSITLVTMTRRIIIHECLDCTLISLHHHHHACLENLLSQNRLHALQHQLLRNKKDPNRTQEEKLKPVEQPHRNGAQLQGGLLPPQPFQV